MMYLVLLATHSSPCANDPPSAAAVVSGRNRIPLAQHVTLHPNIGRQFNRRRRRFALSGTQAARTSSRSPNRIRAARYAGRDRGRQPDSRADCAARSPSSYHPSDRSQQCTSPGRPDSSDAALLAVFDQLQENARRFELLRTLSFHYELELARGVISARHKPARSKHPIAHVRVCLPIVSRHPSSSDPIRSARSCKSG